MKLPKPSDRNVKNITSSQRNLLVRTALHVITEKIPPLRMDFYCHADGETFYPDEVEKVVNECGASCCLIGLAAYLDNTAKEDELWSGFSERALGVSNSPFLNGQFMFSADWSDNRKQAATRVLLWLRGQDTQFDDNKFCFKFNETLRRFCYHIEFLPSYSIEKIKSELKKFLVEE